MHKTASRGFIKRVLPIGLAVPLLVVPVVAYLALSTGSGRGLPVAQGSSGGTLHPLAGDFQPSETELADCDGESTCLEQAFGNLSFRKGPKVALAVFESRIAVDPEVEKNCHRIAHTIGSAALERFDGNVAKTFSLGAATCVSGYYHGILERAFLGVSSKSELGKIARLLCLGGGMRRRGFLDYQCRHGLGHGLMIQTGYDLPLALSLCASLGTGWDDRACAGGAFMENLDTRFGFRSAWLDDEDPLYPCELADPYAWRGGVHKNGCRMCSTRRLGADLLPGLWSRCHRNSALRSGQNAPSLSASGCSAGRLPHGRSPDHCECRRTARDQTSLGSLRAGAAIDPSCVFLGRRARARDAPSHDGEPSLCVCEADPALCRRVYQGSERGGRSERPRGVGLVQLA